jgi:hypothetical protein
VRIRYTNDFIVVLSPGRRRCFPKQRALDLGQ